MGTMAIPDHTGHTVVSWQRGDATSVERASAAFDALVDAKLVPFGRRSPTDDPAQLRGFDAELDEILWVRPLQGG